MKKYFAAVSIIAVVSCTQEQKYEGDSERYAACSSKGFSIQQKADQNLFLEFYYGMTPDEFAREEQRLVSVGALHRTDSTTKFLLKVQAPEDPYFVIDDADECVFTIVPAFDGCSLYSITLECVSKDISAMIKPTDSKNNYDIESKKIPYSGTIRAVEKVYNDKYGKPVVSVLGGINNVVQKEWNVKGKNVFLYKEHGFSQGLDMKNYKIVTGMSVNYVSSIYMQNLKAKQDSVSKIEHLKTLEQVEKGRKSI